MKNCPLNRKQSQIWSNVGPKIENNLSQPQPYSKHDYYEWAQFIILVGNVIHRLIFYYTTNFRGVKL